jgi:hypothetical protein
VELVGNVQYGDSTISHKTEVVPEAKAEGPQRKRRRRRRRRRRKRRQFPST